MEDKKRKRSIIIPKSLMVLSVIFLGLIFLYIYDKNLFPVNDVKLKPGIYELTGEETGRMVVSEGNTIMFEDFDLNAHLKGTYYPEKIDFNRIFLNNNQTFYIYKGLSGIYSVLYNIDEEYFLEIDYYPREDKLVLLKPATSTEFSFAYNESKEIPQNTKPPYP